jgi:hypothetical protein
MPAARRRVTIEKRGGPAAVVAFAFQVGRPPTTHP